MNIFIMNRCISKSYKTSKNGAAVGSIITSYIEVRYIEVHRLLFSIYCVLKGWVEGVFGAYVV